MDLNCYCEMLFLVPRKSMWMFDFRLSWHCRRRSRNESFVIWVSLVAVFPCCWQLQELLSPSCWRMIALLSQLAVRVDSGAWAAWIGEDLSLAYSVVSSMFTWPYVVKRGRSELFLNSFRDKRVLWYERADRIFELPGYAFRNVSEFYSKSIAFLTAVTLNWNGVIPLLQAIRNKISAEQRVQHNKTLWA